MRLIAELHCHTCFSDGLLSPEACVNAAVAKGIQVLAITDHNTAEGVLSLQNHLVPQNVLVIAGEEVSTDLGHVLALFVRKTISPGTFKEVIYQIRAQGGLAFIAHPVHIPLGNRWRKKSPLKYCADDFAMVNGIEVINGHNREPANQLASDLAMHQGLRGIAGSDAHFPFEIGNATTILECSEFTLESLYSCLLSGTIRPQVRRFNAYPMYLFIGLMNKLQGKKYTYKDSHYGVSSK